MTPTRNIAIRRILLPRDTNHRGEIFGGAILAEIDLAGAVEARKHTLHDVATVAVKEVQFHAPVLVGDVVTFYTSVTKVGTTSIHVRVEVESSRDGKDSPVTVTAAELVYVAIRRNQDGTLTKMKIEPPPEAATPDATTSKWSLNAVNRNILASAALASLARQHNVIHEGNVSLSDLGGDLLDAIKRLR